HAREAAGKPSRPLAWADCGQRCRNRCMTELARGCSRPREHARELIGWLRAAKPTKTCAIVGRTPLSAPTGRRRRYAAEQPIREIYLMAEAFICDAARTPIGRYAGALAKVRADDLAAVPIKALVKRNSNVDWEALDEVYLGCANQAGEDNRNVARMALLLAGLPDSVAGVTLNRLCASGLEAVASAARAVRAGDIDMAIAGGVESMTRAPFVLGKAQEAFQRSSEIHDTTIGWRFVNPVLKAQYGIDSMPETGENVAEE